MKKIETLLLVLLTVLSVNSFATVHTVFYGTSTNVVCFAGDTIRFKDMSFTPTMVSINTTSGPVIITSPMFTTPDAAGFIIDYVVTGNETAYGMNHSSAGSNGTITVQVATGINTLGDTGTNIKMFPNPSTDVLFVNTSVDAELNILSITGELIIRSEIKPGNNRIDIQSLSSGVYFARINNTSIKILKL